MDDFDKIAEQMQGEFEGPSMLEMELGTHLSALMYVLDHPNEFATQELYSDALEIILSNAEPWLVEWHDKYIKELHPEET